MTNLSIEFCQKIKEARREAKLGQVEVAAKVGCKQSALCMFERGGVTKLNDDVIKRLSDLFNVKIITTDANEDVTTVAPSFIPTDITTSCHGFCPNASCPSNHAYEVEGRTFFRPDRNLADPVGGKFCAVCGEVLVKKCPNCGAPVHDGAICSLCGDPYVVV